MGHYESDLELFLFNSLIKQFAFNLENYMAFSFDHLARSNSIAVMGILKIDFIWYVKNISLLALMGYLAGAATYMLMQ